MGAPPHPCPSPGQIICEQYGTTTVQGRYIAQNNRWGTGATQCIDVGDTGFTLTYGYVGNATHNASFDIRLDPQPKTDGVNKTEIMIWFNRVGSVQPLGQPVNTANVGGRSWEVWTGNNDVISFLAPSAIASWSFDGQDSVDHTVCRGMAAANWYLTSVQAGFEPWVGGAGLSLSAFSSSVTDGQDTDGGEGGTGEPGGGTQTPPPAGQAACQVEYAPQVRPGGLARCLRTTASARHAPRGPDRPGAVSYTRGMNNYTCTQCGTVGLVDGFIEDAGEHSRGYARWIEGALERGLFGGAKRMGRPRRRIEAFRCPGCGHLELFASNEV